MGPPGKMGHERYPRLIDVDMIPPPGVDHDPQDVGPLGLRGSGEKHGHQCKEQCAGANGVRKRAQNTHDKHSARNRSAAAL